MRAGLVARRHGRKKNIRTSASSAPPRWMIFFLS